MLFLRKLCAIIILISLCTSCCSQFQLIAYSNYVNEESLASFYANTPDLLLNCPPQGKRIVVSWRIPKGYSRGCVFIDLTLRFGNREEKKERFIVNRSNGSLVYYLLDDDYFAVEGIESYKAELIIDDVIVKTWLHQLWIERISPESVPLEEVED